MLIDAVKRHIELYRSVGCKYKAQELSTLPDYVL
jgi:hypothetical protein